jgi:2-iminobutanoate/2-iminopropanoate deaminase
LLFVSGLLAMDETGATIAPGDAATQTAYIFAQLDKILAAGSSDLSRVAKLVFFLTDLDDRAAITPVRLTVFGAHRPASTLVQVAGLIGVGTVVEIEAVAMIRA